MTVGDRIDPPRLSNVSKSDIKSKLAQTLKSKEEDLRETDDSVRPQRSKKLTISCFEIIRLLGKGKHGTVFLAM